MSSSIRLEAIHADPSHGDSLGQSQDHSYRERNRPYECLQTHLPINIVPDPPLRSRPARVPTTHMHPYDRVVRYASVDLRHFMMFMRVHAARGLALSTCISLGGIASLGGVVESDLPLNSAAAAKIALVRIVVVAKRFCSLVAHAFRRPSQASVRARWYKLTSR